MARISPSAYVKSWPTVKLLAVEYHQLTGRPLGVTGEFAEYVAAEHLGLKLAPPRTAGYNRRDAFLNRQVHGIAVCTSESHT